MLMKNIIKADIPVDLELRVMLIDTLWNKYNT